MEKNQHKIKLWWLVIFILYFHTAHETFAMCQKKDHPLQDEVSHELMNRKVFPIISYFKFHFFFTLSDIFAYLETPPMY